MKPKTIREKIRELVFDYSKPDGLNLGDTTAEILAQIQQLLEECAPEKKPPCGTGTISDDNQEWWCDLDKGFNQAVDQYKSNIRERIK